jgi:hypothetical protein
MASFDAGRANRRVLAIRLTKNFVADIGRCVFNVNGFIPASFGCK